MNSQMINEALRLVRLYWGKSQVELADELGVSQSFLSEIERGTKTVTVDLLKKYSERLNVPMSTLMFFAEEIANNPPKGRGRLFVAGKVLDVLKRLVPDDGEASPN